MSIAKPFTFISGTYAKSAEVNADFDTAYSQINTNISNIAKNADDIVDLGNTKANINGNASEVFNVANPTASSHAVNKQTLADLTANTKYYIAGYLITRDSGSPNNTIRVSDGICYDSTYSVMLKKTVATTKQNTTQSANTRYYVYVIGNSTGSSVDILISTSSSSPALPTGYTVSRLIGYYTTDSSGYIDAASINSYGDSIILREGPWVVKTSSNLFNSTAIGTYTFSLNNYLPQDGGVYEVLFSAYWGSSSNSVSKLYWKTILNTTSSNFIAAADKHGDSSNGGYGTNSFIVPITTRTISVEIKDAAFYSMDIRAIAYKRSR